MSKKYLSNPDYTFEKINKASQACGPMVKWAIAQVSYAEMLRKVDPLRQELSSLETQAAENQKKADETNKLIADLEASIATYTAEYAQLISQAQSIKTDAELVEAKVKIANIINSRPHLLSRLLLRSYFTTRRGVLVFLRFFFTGSTIRSDDVLT